MTTLTIEVPNKVEKTLADLVEQLGGKALMIDSNENKGSNQNIKKLSRKEKEFIKGFEEAIEFVNMHQEGKVKAKTIDRLLNDL